MNRTVTPEDLGLTSTATDMLSSAHALRLARTLEFDDARLTGGKLPEPWVWAFFTPRIPTSSLRPDGHPRVNPDNPLAALDRRMFIGGSFERLSQLDLDVTTIRTTQVAGVEHKRGSTGDFEIVTLEHHYTQHDKLVVRERQQVLYRTAPRSPVAGIGPALDPPPSFGPRLELRPDERLLFRYSALTFNSHRIHYDAAYATRVEGFPGLVVHGPLIATVLFELATRALGTTPDAFSFRAQAPTFVNVDVHFVCGPSEPTGNIDVQAIREDGTVSMVATAHAEMKGARR